MMTKQPSQHSLEDRAEPSALDFQAAKLAAKGWRLIYVGSYYAQMIKPRKWSKLLLIGGLITLPVGGLGLLLWIVAVLEYLLKGDLEVTFTLDQATDAELAGRLVKAPGLFSSPIRLGVIILVFVIGLVVLDLAIYALLFSS